jgi:hydroxycarboxylate dehydrogenase B
MAETTRYHRIAPANLHRAVMAVFRQLGSHEREQRLTSDHLVAANLAGHDSHGVGMIPSYVRAAREKKLAINGSHTVVVDAGPILTIDGGLALGQVVAHDAMNLAMARAKRDGVCILGIRNAHHTGRIGHWAEQCAAGGFVSMHYVSGFAGVTSVAPFGGRETRFQTNPYAAGFPLPGRPSASIRQFSGTCSPLLSATRTLPIAIFEVAKSRMIGGRPGSGKPAA